MKAKIISVFALAALIVIISCRKPNADPGSSWLVNENINIRMNETVDSVKRVLHFRALTEKIYLCTNYWIESSSTVTNDKITINFIKIYKPTACLESPYPASTFFDFNELPKKTYQLVFTFGGGYRVIGQFDVTSSTFTATLSQLSKVQFVNPILKRVPDNTIFGTVHYSKASIDTLVQKYIDSLQFFGAKPALYEPGDYFQYQIQPDGQIKQTQDLGYYFTRYYIFNYAGNTATLRDFVKRWKPYFDSIDITLNTTRGEIFYNWGN